MEKLLNLKDFSALLKISVHTVRLRTYQKKHPVVKLVRRCLYRKNDLEKFVEKMSSTQVNNHFFNKN